jgi:nicotinamide mononucleotide adenylyltransferase
VLHPGITKEIEASEIRRRMAKGEDWQSLVPPAVAEIILQLRERATALS